MRIEVQLTLPAALAWRDRQTQQVSETAATDQLAALEKKLAASDAQLEAVHPGQTHPLLLPFFMIEIPDPQAGEKLLSELLQYDFVEAAYVKPSSELP